MDNTMEKIVSLCKRRGFIFQSSEIYGGIQGFWDYGPLGTELKRNVREAWYRDMVTNHDEISAPPGAPQAFQMVGIETSIIMHPQVWKCSGHYELFNDMRVDCRESIRRYRYDHVVGRWVEGRRHLKHRENATDPAIATIKSEIVFITTEAASDDLDDAIRQRALAYFGLKSKEVNQLKWLSDVISLPEAAKKAPGVAELTDLQGPTVAAARRVDFSQPDMSRVVGPDASKTGTLTEPREFNLMFPTTVGALGTEEDKAFLRPETAQGMFVNFKNVLDSSRVKIPFGIAQIGKSFRNEITPRNFTFRSREFEQMEMEFFCHPGESRKWYEYWRDRRYNWYINLGITSENLILRDHAADELSHYSVGTADVEYAFPFLDAGEYGELEGIAHRGDFDLRSHQYGKLKREGEELVVETDADGKPKYRGSGKDLTYFDDQTRERYAPHVIEPAAGADRATLAFLCEAYTEDEQPDEKGEMQQRIVMKLHPKLAPVKAAVFPLIKKAGMPEKAADIYRELKAAGIAAAFAQQGAIGRRYRQHDEIGTPFCITVDGNTMEAGTVTIRDRDTLAQERIPIEKVVDEVQQRLRG